MFKKTLSVVIPQRMHQCSGKMQDWWWRTSWFDSGSMQFFCVFIFLLFFVVFFFFDKKTESKGIHMLLDNISSLNVQGCDTHNSRERFLISFHFIVSLYNHCLSHVMRKPVYAICEQQRCRSACASAQSDQHLCCCIISLVSISEISSL